MATQEAKVSSHEVISFNNSNLSCPHHCSSNQSVSTDKFLSKNSQWQFQGSISGYQTWRQVPFSSAFNELYIVLKKSAIHYFAYMYVCIYFPNIVGLKSVPISYYMYLESLLCMDLFLGIYSITLFYVSLLHQHHTVLSTITL